jgi:hypothetical protein
MPLLCEKKIYCEYRLATWTNHDMLGESATFRTINLLYLHKLFLSRTYGALNETFRLFYQPLVAKRQVRRDVI